MKLDTLWFLKDPIDMERAEYLILAYKQHLAKNSHKLGSTYKEFKSKYQDLLTLVALRRVESKLSKEEKKRMEWFKSLDLKSEEKSIIYDIVRSAILSFEAPYKKFQLLWRLVEASTDMFYLDSVPADQNMKVGYILIRYYGSHITEVFRYTATNKNKISTKLVGYLEGSYAEIKNQLDPAGTFVVAEIDRAFDTKNTTMPVITNILENQLNKKPAIAGLLK